MISIDNLMTTQTESIFGMPICGLAMITTPRATVEGTTASNAWSLVRDRHVVVTGVEADKGLAQGYFPGTSAWRPPHC